MAFWSILAAQPSLLLSARIPAQPFVGAAPLVGRRAGLWVPEEPRYSSRLAWNLLPQVVSRIKQIMDVGDMVLRIHAMIAACFRTCLRAAPVSPPTKVPWATVSLFLSRVS